MRNSLVIAAAFMSAAPASADQAGIAGSQTVSVRPSKMFDIDTIGRVSDEAWKANGPFGIFLEDEVAHRGARMNADPTSWEDLGFYSVLRSGDTEIYLAVITMFSQGKPQIALMATRGKYGDRSKIVTDTEVLRGSYSDPISVVPEKDRVVWQSAHVQTIAAPPAWHQMGDFVDKQSGKKVEFDILFKQVDQEYWPHWPGYNPGRTGKGVHAPVMAQGVVVIDGTRYVIDQGYSTYERAVMPSRNGTAMGRQDWFNAFCGNKMNFLFFQNGYGATQGFLSAGSGKDKKYYSFGDVSIAVTNRWNDPKLGRAIPTAWRITGRSLQGTFEANGVSYAPILLGTASGPMGIDIYHHLFQVRSKFTPADGSAPTEGVCYGTNEARFPAPGAATQR